MGKAQHDQLLLLQVAEKLNATHCQAALAAVRESADGSALEDPEFQLALKLARRLAEFRGKRQQGPLGTVSPHSPFTGPTMFTRCPLRVSSRLL